MKTLTEFFDGLEFVLPTWDPTPVPWNEGGSWVVDEEAETRVLAGIRTAVPGHEALAEEALTWEPSGPLMAGGSDCHTFWGSHGCDRPTGHDGLHICYGCSAGLEYGDGDTLILWWLDNDDEFRLSVHHWTWFK